MSRVNPQPRISTVEHGARPGPASSYEMRQWEKVAIAELFFTEGAGAERLQTFTDLMCNGMDVDTQCGGLDMLRHSLTNFFHTMQIHGMHSPSVRWLAATDIDTQVQKVLVELAKAEAVAEATVQVSLRGSLGSTAADDTDDAATPSEPLPLPRRATPR